MSRIPVEISRQKILLKKFKKTSKTNEIRGDHETLLWSENSSSRQKPNLSVQCTFTTQHRWSWQFHFHCIRYRKVTSNCRSCLEAWHLQIVYEGESWCIFTVSLWEKLDFHFINMFWYSWLHNSCFWNWPLKYLSSPPTVENYKPIILKWYLFLSSKSKMKKHHLSQWII